jgi:hypothetical protein
MLLNRGAGPNGRLLSEAGFAALTRAAIPTEWSSTEHYAYGLVVSQDDGFHHLSHRGAVPGHGAHLIVDTENGLGAALVAGHPANIQAAWTVLKLWRAAVLGRPPESIDLSLSGPAPLANADDYAGVFRAADDAVLTVEAADGWLFLKVGDEQVALEERDEDRFHAPHPEFDRFLIGFGRDASGAVVEAFYGERWYVNERYAGPREFEHPPEWLGYAGHYRGHNPWQSNFRVLLRKGRLWLAMPNGTEDPLVPLGGAAFQVGTEPTPERIRFGQIADGQALCANLSACDYYRFFTP